jgi:high-affinity iron transporter
MIASSRFLAWLVLPVIAFCSFNALAETAEGAPKALHLLDYIGADYPVTVQAGRVIDESEYREQLEFLGVLQDLVSGLPARPERAELEQGVGDLRSAIAARKDGADVARQARPQ